VNGTPVVSVLVTHHLDENRKYLNLCLEALKAQDYPYEAIVLADSETPPDVPDGFTLVHDRDLNTATKKTHRGVAMADPRSQYFLLLSDDVVMGKDTLRTLVEGLKGRAGIVNPMSNSDNGGQFSTDLDIPCSLDYQDLASPMAYASSQASGKSLLVQRPYVCFYCTLIPRLVWEHVGELDERLENRHNDQDFCYRAALKGIGSYINFGAFAVHFGSKTLDKVAPMELRNEATRVFSEKWKATGLIR